MPVLDRSECNLGKWLCCGFIFFFYAYLVLLVTLAILFMQISSDDAAKMNWISPCSSFLFSRKLKQRSWHDAFMIHDPCFQPEVITLNAEGKKRGNSHARVYGCWQNYIWKLFVLPWYLIPSNSAQCSPLSWIFSNMSGCLQRYLLWNPVW